MGHKRIVCSLVGIVVALLMARGTADDPTLEWVDCPLYTDAHLSTQTSRRGPLPSQHNGDDVLDVLRDAVRNPLGIPFDPRAIPRTSTPRAMCAFVDLPLYPTNPDDTRTVTVFVKKIPGKETATKQVWLLQGGPGGSSSSLEPTMHSLYDLLEENFDILTLDHRGVGRSRRLSCKHSQAETAGSAGGVVIVNEEWPACIEEVGETLDFHHAFTSDNAARDVAKLVELISQESNPPKTNYVYGISYGTMWAQRYLALFPDQSPAVILDGIVSQEGAPGLRFAFDLWDRGMNEVGFAFLNEYCTKSDVCTKHLGDNPAQFVQDVFNKHVTQGHCAEFQDDLRTDLGLFLMIPDIRTLIAALIYRLNRCNDDDKAAFKHLLAVKQEMMKPAVWHGLDSDILQKNVGSSELWEYPGPSLDELKEELETYYFATGLSVQFCPIVEEFKYPQYPRDPDTFNQTADAPNTRVLLLNGDLDPQTPIKYARHTNAALEGRTAWHRLVEIPGSVHFTVGRSPTKSSDVPCGMQILVSFLKNPNAEPDTSCLNDLEEVDFVGDPARMKQLLGTDDIYDGVPEDESPQDGDDDDISKDVFAAVVSVLGVLAIVLLVGLFFVLWKHRKNARSESGRNFMAMVDTA